MGVVPAPETNSEQLGLMMSGALEVNHDRIEN
jgi:hypothetical protein